jgi:hypothetical protein
MGEANADTAGDRVYPNIAALEGLDEGFGHSVALRALNRGEAGGESQRQGDVDGLRRGINGAVVRQPLDAIGRPRRLEPPLHAFAHHVRIISPEMPAVVAVQPITTPSTTSPLEQVSSSPSEHQRGFDRTVATLPVCSRCRRRPV